MQKRLDVIEKAEEFALADRLQRLFIFQKHLQNRLYGIELPEERPELLPVQITAVVGELGEILTNDSRWKPWKNQHKEFDRILQLEEVVDLLHFIINIFLMCGFDADEIYVKFLEKNQINHERQESGY